MACARRALCALACAATCDATLAERSLLDGDEVEVGDCELELAAERRSARDAAAERESAIQLDCGIGWRTALVATAARRRGGDGGERGEAFAIEAKTLLVGRGVGGISWSAEYGAGAERSGGEPWRRSVYFVALDATFRPVEAWALEARLGWVRDRVERRSTRVWTLLAEHEVSDRLEVSVELEDDARSRAAAGVELRYEFWPDRARVNLFYGGRAGPARERRVGLGVTFEF